MAAERRQKASTNASRTNLGAMLRAYRLLSDREQRGLAAEIGISAATLCRMEGGYQPDVGTLMKLLTWFLAVRR